MFNQRDGKFFTFRPLFFTFLKNLKLLFFFLWYNDRESRWRVELAGKLQKPRGAACPPQVWYNDRESRWRVELAGKLQKPRGAACPPQVWNHKAAPVHRSGWEEHLSLIHISEPTRPY